jgi:hypothetical protein
MIIGVQGSRNFDDYNVFMRSMTVALSSLPEGDSRFTIYAAGPVAINNFVAGYVNTTEDMLRDNGIKSKFNKVPYSWIEDNVDQLDYFVFLSKPGERLSQLAQFVDEAGVEVGWFYY